MPDNLSEFIGYAAKAVAAFLVPWVLFAVDAFAVRVGIEVPVDPTKVEAVIVSIVLAVVVYVRRNAPAQPAPPTD